MSQRCWEETRYLGRELSDLSPSRRHLVARLRELDRYFALGTTPEQEAVHILVSGLLAALEDRNAWPRNGGDDE